MTSDITSRLLKSVASRHFATRTRQSLMSRIGSFVTSSNLTKQDLVEAFGSRSRPVLHLAWQKLVQFSPEELNRFIEDCLRLDSADKLLAAPALLRSVSRESIQLSNKNLATIRMLVESHNPEIRVAAASCLALRASDLVVEFVRSDALIEPELLRSFCLAEDDRLIIPLMKRFGFPERNPPPMIGCCINPEWLAEHQSEEPVFVEWLAFHCGYCDELSSLQVLEYGLVGTKSQPASCSREFSNAQIFECLKSGISFVSTPMVLTGPNGTVVSNWNERIRELMWQLLPSELDINSRESHPLNVDDPIDVSLFLAAVRNMDRLRFLEQKQAALFDRRVDWTEPQPRCFQANARYVRNLFVVEPMNWADRWKIEPHGRGDLLIDWARVLLEIDEETQTAADRALRGKWANPHGFEKKLIRNSLDSFPVEPLLSRGAQSTTHLASVCGFDCDAMNEWLLDAETRWSQFLVPIGIEIQIPRVDADEFAEWKNLLPKLGVPSPVRPEFGGMIEAAFQPARSFHAMIIGPHLLRQIGVIAQAQDMALHISIQGDLGDDVRFLAFPYHFIHPSRHLTNRPDWSMSRIMSKGFVHVHSDAINLDQQGELTERTEIRTFRLFAENNDGNITLSRSFEGEVISVHILASALLSPCMQCRAFFSQYADEVTRMVASLPEEFGQLLDSNYFESTGDPRDPILLSLLPIFCRWSNVRRIVRASGLSCELDRRFRQIRNRSVKEIFSHLESVHDMPTRDILIEDDELLLKMPDLDVAM